MNITKLKLKLKDKKKRGFTLIELMVVLAVIAVIVSIAVPNFDAIRQSVNTKVDKQSCETIKNITRTYVADGTLEKSLTFIYTPSSTVDGVGMITGDISNDNEIIGAFSEVKQPQTAKDAGYKVKIDNGKVTVQVEGKPDTSTGVPLDGVAGGE